MSELTIVKASPNDIGCWVEGSRGKYAMPYMIRRAMDHGFPVSPTEVLVIEAYERGEETLAGTQYGEIDTHDWLFDSHELGDKAEEWLNEHVAPDGHTFGWLDGEFFLWSDEEWAE